VVVNIYVNAINAGASTTTRCSPRHGPPFKSGTLFSKNNETRIRRARMFKIIISRFYGPPIRVRKYLYEINLYYTLVSFVYIHRIRFIENYSCSIIVFVFIYAARNRVNLEICFKAPVRRARYIIRLFFFFIPFLFIYISLFRPSSSYYYYYYTPVLI